MGYHLMSPFSQQIFARDCNNSGETEEVCLFLARALLQCFALWAEVTCVIWCTLHPPYETIMYESNHIPLRGWMFIGKGIFLRGGENPVGKWSFLHSLRLGFEHHYYVTWHPCQGAACVEKEEKFQSHLIWIIHQKSSAHCIQKHSCQHNINWMKL